MATATTLSVIPGLKGSYSASPLSEEAASKTTELLQENHSKYHMYFNESGFHNHLARHLLALYAFNAPPDVLKTQYDANKSYQWLMKPVDRNVLQNLEDPAKFKQYLFKRDHYHDYLALFESEIEKHGWVATVNKYLFAGDERANSMLDRLWAGILHPLIHLGYGIEWQQPAIIAEALAMCATHDEYLSRLFQPASAQAAAAATPSRTLFSLLQEAAQDANLRECVTHDQGLRLRDGVLGAGQEAIVKLTSQWTVAEDENDINAKLAELCNVSAYVFATAQHPKHRIRFDFFFLHCLNSTPLVAAIVHSKDFDIKHRREVLERSGRFLLATFVGQHSPGLYLDRVREYEVKKGKEAEWDGIVQRIMQVRDDSHVIKCARALRHGEMVCRGFEGKGGFPFKQEDWIKVGNMLADLAQEWDSNRFVSPSGWDEAWEEEKMV